MVADVAGFYSGASVFVTGGTGFLGKCLLEKLLRSCPDIGNIYVLCRSKKGSTPEQRIEALFDYALFERVNRDNPESKRKVLPITGDILEDNLGISPEDEAKLIAADINVVIHSAATLRFNEPLRSALLMNVGGTQKVISLCRKFPNLRCLVHVSTAYSNCDQKYIRDQLYPAPADPHKLLDALDWMTEEAAEKLTPVLIGKKPNTYTYTKHLAESLLEKEAGSLPYIIVRPSIVGASMHEPFPGWIDNYNGPSGLLVATGMGLMRTYKCNPDAVADIIPVDIVVNTIIVAPWYRVLTNEPCTLNCTSDSANQMTWGRFTGITMKALWDVPYNSPLRYPSCDYSSSVYTYGFYMFVCHKLPAVLVDAILKCLGKKPKMQHMYNKLHSALDVLEFFTNNTWEWEIKNRPLMQKQMTESDCETFNTDVSQMDWNQYLTDFVFGTKKFLMKEDMKDLGKARQTQFRLKTIHYILNFMTGAAVCKMVMLRSEVATKFFNLFLQFCVRRVKALRLDSVITW